MSGVEKLHAVVGGFHLSGFMYESIIAPTVAAIGEMNPDFLVPTHCTGWKAIHEFAKHAPDAFIQNSVGTTLLFGSPPNS